MGAGREEMAVLQADPTRHAQDHPANSFNTGDFDGGDGERSAVPCLRRYKNTVGPLQCHGASLFPSTE